MKLLNGFLNKCSIAYAHRMTIFRRMLPLTGAFLLASGILYNYRSEAALQRLHSNQLSLLSDTSNLLSHGIFEALRELDYMANQFEQLRPGTGNGRGIEKLRTVFLSAAELNDRYLQIRWIDTSGMERVRVDRLDSGPSVIDASALQNKSSRYYVQEASRLPRGEFYISNWDLNQEGGAIQVPYVPVIRIARPVFDGSGKRAGMLVINLDARQLLPLLDRLSEERNPDLFLIDSKGEWIKGETPEDSWSEDLDRAEPFAQRYPELWETITNASAGEYTGEEGYWVYSRFSFHLMGFSTGWKIRSPEWILVTRSSVSTFMGFHLRSFLESLIFFLGSGILLVFIFAQKFISESERKELMNNLDRTRSRLMRAERLSSMGLLMAGLSHELNTPIGAAQLMTSSLMNELAESEKTDRSKLEPARLSDGLSLIKDGLDRAADLVRTIKRMSVDRQSARLQWFNLSEVVQDVSRIMEAAFTEQNHRIQLEIDPKIKLFGAPGPLSEVIQILAANALEHAFESRNGVLSIKATQSQRYCYLSISDNGMGIDQGSLLHIFDPFFTTARNRGHAGIGLSIAQELVHGALQGRINVRSASASGTRFRISMPLVAQPPRNIR